MIHQITPRQLKAWLDDPQKPSPFIIDVRDATEFEVESFSASFSWPEEILLEEAERFIYKDASCVVVCAGYDHALSAALELQCIAFTQLYVLLGGIYSWKKRFSVLA